MTAWHASGHTIASSDQTTLTTACGLTIADTRTQNVQPPITCVTCTRWARTDIEKTTAARLLAEARAAIDAAKAQHPTSLF